MPKAVYHGGVGVRADQRIGESDSLAVNHAALYNAGKIFKVYLVANALRGRDDPEIVKSGLAPAEKFVALAVALKLAGRIEFKSLREAACVHLHAVVNDKVDRDARVDAPRVASKTRHGAAHGCKVNHAGHAREILQQNPARPEGDFNGSGAGGIVPGKPQNIIASYGGAVFTAEQAFQKNLY